MNLTKVLTAACLMSIALGSSACKSESNKAPAQAASPATPPAATPPAAPASAPAAAVPAAFDQKPAVGATAKCPVSGETFTIEASTLHTEYNGKHYAFCCGECKPKFEADPAKFAAK
jgi:Cu+-exporting ATPase